MKVNIGPYVRWVGPYQIADMIFFWVEKYTLKAEELENRWDYKLHDKFGDWLVSTFVNDFCNWYHGKFKKRKEYVRIDGYDVYSMDHTLALVIVPMLKELRKLKNGSPDVDNEDVPKHLQLSKRERKIFDESGWNKRLKVTEKEVDFINKKYHDRWDWVLMEMIHAFECELEEDWEKQFTSGVMDINHEETIVNGKKMFKMVHGPNHTYEIDKEAMNKAYERRKNGRMLFAKYYNSLWW
jgi:hypothetical protein